MFQLLLMILHGFSSSPNVLVAVFDTCGLHPKGYSFWHEGSYISPKQGAGYVSFKASGIEEFFKRYKLYFLSC